MSKQVLLLAVVAFVAGCSMPPPEPWLRAELDGRTTLRERGPGSLVGSLVGADVQVDLYEQETFLRVTIDNRSPAPVTVRVGPDAGANRGAIGQVLLRRLDDSIGGPDMMPYNSLQAQLVEPGWRATLYLDQPIGHEPKLGQIFVVALEAEGADGARERHLLPLTVKRSGNRTPRAR